MSDDRLKIRLEDGRVGTVDRAEWESGSDDLTSFQPLEPAPAPAQSRQQPSQPMRPSQPQEPGAFDSGGPVEAFGREALQTLSFGTADELAGAEQAAMNRMEVAGGDPRGDAQGRVGRGIGGQPPTAQQYTQEIRGQYGQLAEDNPRATTAGTVVGGAVQAAALPIPGAAGETLPARLMSAAKTGAPIGAAHGLGRSDSDDPATMLRDTAVGAAGGALGGAGGQALGEGLAAAANQLASSEVGQAVGRWASEQAQGLGDKAARLRVRAGGARYAKDANKIDAQPGGIEAQGREMLEMGIGTGKPKLGSSELAPGARVKLLPQRVEQYAADAEAVRKAAGQQMEWVSSTLSDNGVPVDGNRIAQQLLDEAADLSALPGSEGRANALQALAEQWEAQGQVPFAQAHKALQEFGKGTKFTSDALAQEDKRLVYSTVRRAMQDAADGADPALGAAWREGTRAYQVGKSQGDAARNWIEGQERNRQVSLTDYRAAGGVGLGSLLTGSTPVEAATHAVAAGALNKAVRGREHSIGAALAQRGASAMEGLSSAIGGRASVPAASAVGGAETTAVLSLPERVQQIVSTNPGELGPYGHVLAADPDNFAVNLSLLQQTDPDFQERMRKLEEKEQKRREREE